MNDSQLDDIIRNAEKALGVLGFCGRIENPGNRPLDAYGLLTTVSATALLLRFGIEGDDNELTREQKYHVLSEVQSIVFADDMLLATTQRLTELMCLIERRRSASDDTDSVWNTLSHLVVAAAGLSAAAMAVPQGGVPITHNGEPRVYGVRDLVQLSRDRADAALKLIDEALAKDE